jgi:hypothetical protein
VYHRWCQLLLHGLEGRPLKAAAKPGLGCCDWDVGFLSERLWLGVG